MVGQRQQRFAVSSENQELLGNRDKNTGYQYFLDICALADVVLAVYPPSTVRAFFGFWAPTRVSRSKRVTTHSR